MSHILIGGDLRSGPAVRSLLQSWGMTCGDWFAGDQGLRYPTINDCDALILLNPSSTPLPEGPRPSPDPAWAPLLLLGEYPGFVLPARDAWRVIKEPGPGGVDLKFALQSCLEQTREMRGQDRPHWEKADQEGYLTFLGHELRSPLTAAKTALEVLQGELGGLLAEGQGQQQGPGPGTGSTNDSRLKMLDIALRNIKRLHRTVDWSQDLLELESSAPRGIWSPIGVADLAQAAAGVTDFVIDEGARDHFLETDQNLLRVLVGQAIRVLDYALPGCPLTAVARLDPIRERCLELGLHPAANCGCPDKPRITRTHLTPAVGSRDCGPQEELERLVGYVVSQPLLDQLQAQVAVQSNAEDVPGLVIRLVLVGNDPTGEQTSEESPAALRAPA